MYHVAERPDGVHWDGIEYYSAKLRRGVLYAFRGTVPDAADASIPLAWPQGRGSRYRLKFQDQGRPPIRVLTGEALMQEGIEVSLALPLSSELIFLEEVP